MDDFACQLAALRPLLVRLARQRLNNEAWAEDAVSETLVAALENPKGFAGRARLKTWLVGILKHKLVDQVRRHGREQSAGGAGAYEEAFDGWADTTPLWGIDTVGSWGDPQDRLVRRQFLQQLQVGLESLPAQHSRAFVLRECLDLDTEEVCRELGVSANNLSVMLHRARLRLREALLLFWLPGSSARQGVPPRVRQRTLVRSSAAPATACRQGCTTTVDAQTRARSRVMGFSHSCVGPL